eukprot:gnl/TRDRNA2_/TRDRNA2_165511_c0_seq2.p1 gnl/TRDRNA2_/TRDRNA2_165511_c0~~gnl/TRDRNA2_/TRDRNA2_165511_c0_seq2.p1  ORF type:complete len:364 (+),score=25.37 gnl/TRDRNA2_/TRDRNA2_165511_c0_seq2:68-1159(+)
MSVVFDLTRVDGSAKKAPQGAEASIADAISRPTTPCSLVRVDGGLRPLTVSRIPPRVSPVARFRGQEAVSEEPHPLGAKRVAHCRRVASGVRIRRVVEAKPVVTGRSLVAIEETLRRRQVLQSSVSAPLLKAQGMGEVSSSVSHSTSTASASTSTVSRILGSSSAPRWAAEENLFRPASAPDALPSLLQPSNNWHAVITGSHQIEFPATTRNTDQYIAWYRSRELQEHLLSRPSTGNAWDNPLSESSAAPLRESGRPLSQGRLSSTSPGSKGAGDPSVTSPLVPKIRCAEINARTFSSTVCVQMVSFLLVAAKFATYSSSCANTLWPLAVYTNQRWRRAQSATAVNESEPSEHFFYVQHSAAV